MGVCDLGGLQLPVLVFTKEKVIIDIEIDTGIT